MVGVLVVSDVQIFREGLVLALSRSPEFDVWQCALRSADALRVIRRHQPRVALVDLTHPESLHIVTRVAREAPQVAQVALGVPDDAQQIIACAEAGASGFVPHDASLHDLREAVLDADRGALRCAPQMAHRLFCHVGKLCANGTAHEPGALTRRERQILEMIERGAPNQTIADELGIGLSTVKNHVHSLLAKLGVRRRGEAAAYHRRNHL